ncbi:Nuclear factor 7, ovary [Labeo rohita]|uniref:Nuclear factor 7, ovary n=1 Tax=Labeo rohita TaxID=84645 RepID=A0ABQ8LZF8_LABRO|nr:Nuclear factor 7, ovary [Labeo rohita]
MSSTVLENQENSGVSCLQEKILKRTSSNKDSQKHINHTFRPISEVVPSYKEELNTALKSLQEKLKRNEKLKEEFEKTVQHIKSQAEHTERRIKQQFEKLHQFLRDEEEATITALREEEEQKKQMMKEKLEEMNRHISALSHTIKDTEETMKANDICFLKSPDLRAGSTDAFWSFDSCVMLLGQPAIQSLEEDAGHCLINDTPVILDPNTAHPRLVLSDDLTSVRDGGSNLPLPHNPERFDEYYSVLGSEGFNSGKHCWDVEVKDSQYWNLGVTTALNQRKGWDFFNTDVWSVRFKMFTPTGFPVEQRLKRVRVDLDYDRGTVSFSDPDSAIQYLVNIMPVGLDRLAFIMFPIFNPYHMSSGGHNEGAKEWNEPGVSASRVTTLRCLQEKGQGTSELPETFYVG